MKYFLQENVKEFICFKPAGGINGNPIVVRTHEMNPVDYGIASIIRAELLDEEITVSFIEMIRHKMKAQQTGTSFPFSAESYFEELDKNNPIKEIFNAVLLSHDPLVPKNKFCYAAPKSSVKAIKIWYEFSLLLSLLFPNLAVTGSQSYFQTFNLYETPVSRITLDLCDIDRGFLSKKEAVSIDDFFPGKSLSA